MLKVTHSIILIMLNYQAALCWQVNLLYCHLEKLAIVSCLSNSLPSDRKNMIKKILSEVRRWLSSKEQTISYSQSGEDLLINFIFNQLSIKKPTYLDLGAHNHKYLSNTYFFYKRGSSGINVEADPKLISDFSKYRKRDVNLNVGVCPEGGGGHANFYLMSESTMNTFCEKTALRLDKETNIKIQKLKRVPVLPISEILSKHSSNKFPDLLSVDIEGLDSLVVESIQKYSLDDRPVVICIETIEYAEKTVPKKKLSIAEDIKSLGYFHYADTWINSIFVRNDLFVDSYEKIN
jgi:FkbM family methyltransferase